MNVEFTPWPKIARFRGNHVTITEKIDGTNAALIIQEGQLVGYQSRSRLIKPGDDNYGFAFWAYEDKTALETLLGDGTHFGEWVGPGIQKNPHNLARKTFFLFNTARWEMLPLTPEPVSQLRVVPVLYQGTYEKGLIENVMANLEVAARDAGYTPEGVIVYWHDTRTYQKATFKTPEGKWKEAA